MLVVALAMVISMLAAGLAGALIPLLLRRFGHDPATSTSIILTTVTDVVGFSPFLGIATLPFGIFEATRPRQERRCGSSRLRASETGGEFRQPRGGPRHEPGFERLVPASEDRESHHDEHRAQRGFTVRAHAQQPASCPGKHPA